MVDTILTNFEKTYLKFVDKNIAAGDYINHTFEINCPETLWEKVVNRIMDETSLELAFEFEKPPTFSNGKIYLPITVFICEYR